MKVTREKTENCQAFLTVEMEPDEVEESLEASYHRLAQKANIPGFRKGKAPRSVVERYLGKKSLLDDALEHLVPQAYEQAVKEQNIEPYAQPDIEITQTDPLIFKAVVPLPPKVELGDYHQIQVTPDPVETTEDNINAVMEELRHQHATWMPVERPVDFGDMVVMDIESYIEEKPFVKKLGAQYQIVKDSPVPTPGFAEQLVGINKGEEKEFKLKFPDDYYNKELAGKEGSFKVKVSEIKEEKLPELNDELAKQVSPEFETLDSLREKVAADLKLRAEEKAKTDFEEKVINAAIDLAQMESPPVLTEMEIDRLLREQASNLQRSGIDLEQYLKSINKTEAELREELRPLATKNVTASLVLSKVAEEEKIEVSDNDIGVEIENITGNVAAEKKDEMVNYLGIPQMRDSIRRSLMTRKTLDRLVGIAKESDTANTSEKEEKK